MRSLALAKVLLDSQCDPACSAKLNGLFLVLFSIHFVEDPID